MPEMKTLNGLEVVDAQARADIEAIKLSGGGGVAPDLSDYVTEDELAAKGYATTSYVDSKISSGGGGTTQDVYQHHIALATVNTQSTDNNAYNTVNVVINNTSATPFTVATFTEFLANGGYTSNENYYPACGGVIDRVKLTSIDYNEDAFSGVIGIMLDGTNIKAVYIDPLAKNEKNRPCGGLINELMYDTTQPDMYGFYYQYFNDKVHAFKAVVSGDSVTKGYVDSRVAELEAALAALNAKIEGGNA